MVLSRSELLGRRLAAQSVIGAAGSAPDVSATVRRLFAVQAQDFGHSLWAIGLRTPGSTRSDVLQAMAEGSIVRSSSLRGTLMLVAAEDLRGILALTAERTIASTRTRHRQLELDEETMTRSQHTLESALAGRPLGRDAVLRTLEDAGIRTDSQRGYHILWLLAERGIVCWGPPSGAQQALVLVDEWIEPSAQLDRDELLARFTLRYFIGHGPATVADLAWWARLTHADVRRGIAAAGEALCEVSAEGTSYWMATDSTTPPRLRSDAIVLPGFDEYLLGYSDRSAQLDPEHFERVVPGSNGIFLPTIVSAGQVIGTWRRAVLKGVMAFTPEPFGELSPSQSRTFEAAAARYSEFAR